MCGSPPIPSSPSETPAAVEHRRRLRLLRLVALLLDAGPGGQWATEKLSSAHLLAPSLVMFEASNIIRRHQLAGLVSADQAAQAPADLLDLSIEQWPYEVLGSRVWELRANLSAYDASYVAVAELAGAPWSPSTVTSAAHRTSGAM